VEGVPCAIADAQNPLHLRTVLNIDPRMILHTGLLNTASRMVWLMRLRSVLRERLRICRFYLFVQLCFLKETGVNESLPRMPADTSINNVTSQITNGHCTHLGVCSVLARSIPVYILAPAMSPVLILDDYQ
jgi:hypothetical protein